MLKTMRSIFSMQEHYIKEEEIFLFCFRLYMS